jgi:hypothetical protein
MARPAGNGKVMRLTAERLRRLERRTDALERRTDLLERGLV